MSLKIVILVGTMTGTAQLVAQELELAYGDDGLQIVVQPMDALGADAFADTDPLYLVCTSTYGQGDVPDNARPFFDALQGARPDLSAVRYGVLGLGDRTYRDTFNHGGMKFDRLLAELGATRVGERATLDAADGELAEDKALEWMAAWLETVRAAA
jgi:MioC protein